VQEDEVNEKDCSPMPTDRQAGRCRLRGGSKCRCESQYGEDVIMCKWCTVELDKMGREAFKQAQKYVWEVLVMNGIGMYGRCSSICGYWRDLACAWRDGA
jgi:hypothetical protein